MYLDERYAVAFFAEAVKKIHIKSVQRWSKK